MNLFKSIAALAALLACSLASASDFLVSTEWLAKNLKNKDIRILEVSESGGMRRGHIPGAVNLSWHTDLVDPVKRDIVSREHLEDLLQKAGVNKDSTIVLYGDTNNWFAAWGAWVFDIYQIDNVKLLDGGRNKWEAEKRDLSPVARKVSRGNIRLNDANPNLRARLSDVVAVAEQREADLIDIRSPDEYQGKVFAPAGIQELSIRAGHVPGAVNVPWGQAVAADGTFKSPEELRKIYAAVGVDGDNPVITYCRIGERSSHTWFALEKTGL